MSPVMKRNMNRRTIAAPPQVQDFIQQILSASESTLSQLLNSFNKWTFPKGDLFQWIDVLNKLDGLLETICRKYELRTVQTIPFEDNDKQVLVAIVRFSTFLLDHCANRSLYASGNNINELLSCNDLDVVEQACRISLRLAQRASHQRAGRNHFSISQDKLWKLAMSLQHGTKEHVSMAVSMQDLVASTLIFNQDWSTMCYWYFSPGTRAEDPASPSRSAETKRSLEQPNISSPVHISTVADSKIPESPAAFIGKQSRGARDGPVMLQISEQELQASSIENILSQLLLDVHLPEEYHFEAMLHIRFSKFIKNEYRRRQMVNIRILSLAALAYTVNESVLQTRLFSLEADLIQQLGHILNPDTQLPDLLRASCLSAMEAIAHHRTKLGEVLGTLGASISHGLLMYTLRTSFVRFESTDANVPSDLIDSLISLLHYLSTTNVAGSMLCSAGLVQVLVSLITNKHDNCLRLLVKALNLLDHLVYGFPQAFEVFCDSQGLQILVDRIVAEVDRDIISADDFEIIGNSKADYAMSHERFSLLKTMLKFVVHMMQTSGTADGLRNLIETKLPRTMKAIFENVHIFGASVFASTSNIMATFIHNEPSNYQILSEVSLPKTFLETVNQNILPAFDALTVLPNAFGAICLSNQGMALFKEIDPMPAFMSILSSPRHCEIMRDSDIAGLLGSSMDELVRHHPSLKNSVMECLLNNMQAVNRSGATARDMTDHASRFFSLSESSQSLLSSLDREIIDLSVKDEDGTDRAISVIYIDIIARFLEGLLQNANHAKDFITRQGHIELLRFYDIPCLSYDFAKSHAALSLSHVLRLVCEVDANVLLDAILPKANQCLQDLDYFLDNQTPSSFFDPYLRAEVSGSEGSRLVHQLQKAHSLSVLLSDLYAAPLVSSGRSALPFFQSFATNDAHQGLLDRFGKMHRQIVWEEIKIAHSLPPAWVHATQPKDESWEESEKPQETNLLSTAELGSNRFRDLKMVRFFLCQIPPCIVPIFQGLSRLLIGRRGLDYSQRTIALRVAARIANILLEHLTWQHPLASEKTLRQTYSLMMLTVTQLLICDERSHAILITSVLIGFVPGIQQMSTILLSLWQDIKDVPQGVDSTDNPESASEMARIYGAMKLILHLFQHFTSKKSLLESPQTLQLDSKERNRDKADFFHPSEFLQQLRALILPTIARLWNSDEISIISPAILKDLIVVLTHCITLETMSPLPRVKLASTDRQDVNSDEPTNTTGMDNHSQPVIVSTDTSEISFKPTIRFEEHDSAIACEEIRRGAIRRAIHILSLHQDMVSDLANMIMVAIKYSTSADHWLRDAIRQIIVALSSSTGNDPMTQKPAKVSAFFDAITHLFARICHDEVTFGRCAHLFETSITELMHTLQTCSTMHEKERLDGFAYLLIVFDSLLAHFYDTIAINTDISGGVTAMPPRQGLFSFERRQSLLRNSLYILPRLSCGTAFLSALRFLVRLTRHRDMVDEFLERQGVSVMFEAMRKHIATSDDNLRTTFIILLRHHTENANALDNTMKSEIRSWFSNRTRAVDLSNYVKQNLAIALRDPGRFIAMTEELCCLPRYDESTTLQTIGIRATSSANLDASVNDLEPCVPVLHYLLDEIYRLVDVLALFNLGTSNTPTTRKDGPEASINDGFNDTIRSAATVYSSSFTITAASQPFRKVEHPNFMYFAWMLSALAELLYSYTFFKTVLLSYKPSDGLMRSVPSIPGSHNVVSLLVHKLACFGFGHISENVESKKTLAIEQQAREAIAMLCTKTREVPALDISHVHKVVLDAIIRKIRDTLGCNDPLEMRYNTIISLTELISRLISADGRLDVEHASEADNQHEIGRLMLEKNFVNILTHVISDIDLQYPSAKRVIRSILKPLRSLTKLSSRISETVKMTSSIEDDQLHENDDFETENTSIGGEHDDDRDHTPDLYRNSALAMFGAEMHDSDEDAFEGDGDEQMVRNYDEAMDYDEDGSETGSAVSDEEFELDEGAGSHQHDVEIILDDEHDQDSDESESSDDESMNDTEDDESLGSDGLDALEDGTGLEWNTDDFDNAEEFGIGQATDNILQDLQDHLMGDTNAEDVHHGLLIDNDNDVDDLLSEDAGAEEYDLINYTQEEDPWAGASDEPLENEPHGRSNIASRLWASLASGNAEGEGDSEIRILRRPRPEFGDEASLRLHNPVLSRPNSTAHTASLRHTQPDNFSEWIHSIEALVGGGAVQLVGDILRRPTRGSGAGGNVSAIRVEVAGNSRDIGPAQMDQILQRSPTPSSSSPLERIDDPILATTFGVATTLKRLQDEAIILYGNKVSDRVMLLVAKILETMKPRAIAEAQTRRDQERLEAEMANKGSSLPASEEIRSGDQHVGQDAMKPDESDRLPGAEPTNAVPPVEPPRSNAQPSAQGQVLTIRGHAIDITGLGIDADFLEALPEDMREEVLTQHIRERRLLAHSSQNPVAELSPEFLEALPTEIRTELIQQEAADRRRQQRNSRQARDDSATGPSEIDPASFLASLDPVLRQSILAEQDPGFLEQLPADMIIDLQNRSQTHRATRLSDEGVQHIPITETLADGDTNRSKRSQNGLQLLDKSGVASLLRLIFLPSPQRNMLHDVLLNLCENRATRNEIVGQLLAILQEGSADLSSSERSLSLLTKRARLSTAETPMRSPKKPNTSSTLGTVSPSLLAHQCLQALSFLLHWNDRTSSYFLVEHDVSQIRKLSRTKGKSKDINKAWRYPINNVMQLLDRGIFLTSSELLEQLSHLLSSITRPLLLLLKSVSDSKDHDAQNVMTIVAEAALVTTTGTTEQADSTPSRSGKLQAPEVPRDNLKLIVNIITADACSGKAFQQTLSTIFHLSTLPGAKSVICDELLLQAQSFVARIVDDLSALQLNLLGAVIGTELDSLTLSKFSSAKSDQAKFLRVLKTIDYMYDTTREKASSNEPAADAKLRQNGSLFGNLQLSHLWQALSQCLAVIYEKAGMIQIATALLPLIEALMVVCKNAVLLNNNNNNNNVQAHDQQDVSSAEGVLQELFFTFTEEHKKILNSMVRNNPILMSGSFALLTVNPKVLDFDNKRNYFSRQIKDRGQQKEHYPPIHLNVRRDAVFFDSYKELNAKPGNEIKHSKLNIRFVGEEGVDAGGVGREWFQVLARQMFDPNYALFVPVNADRNTYHPNKTSGINPEHLLFFKFVGRIIGKALYDGKLLDCHFSRPIYRKILGKNVSLKDMETLDLEYYKSLMWMLENDITDVITETFSVERDDFGVVNIIDLIPNGRNIVVTEHNKQEYVARVTEYRLLESVSQQLDNFMQGFNDIIPSELVCIFNEHELELLISGLPDIDTDDWKNNTEYQNYSTASPQIQWFWRAVRSFDDEERARLLQFCTGSSRIPIEGFAHLEGMHGVQKFSIHRDYNKGSRLPQSHTCFNQLDLPEYETYEALRSSLLLAISEGNEGFGFV